MVMTKERAKVIEKEFGKDSEVYRLLVLNNVQDAIADEQTTYTGVLDPNRTVMK